MTTSDPTTPDAVAMLQRIHARAVYCANHGDVPRISSAEVLVVLRAIQAERARHAEEVAELKARCGPHEMLFSSLRSLLPDVRACAEYCRNILIGPPGMPVEDYPLAPVALAARRILAALDSQGGEGE